MFIFVDVDLLKPKIVEIVRLMTKQDLKAECSSLYFCKMFIRFIMEERYLSSLINRQSTLTTIVLIGNKEEDFDNWVYLLEKGMEYRSVSFDYIEVEEDNADYIQKIENYILEEESSMLDWVSIIGNENIIEVPIQFEDNVNIVDVFYGISKKVLDKIKRKYER